MSSGPGEHHRTEGEAPSGPAEDRWRLLVERHPDAIVTSTGREVTYVNPAAVELFGANSSGELLGRSIFDLFAADEQEAVEARAAAVERGEPAPRRELRLRRLDGEIRRVEAYSVPFQLDGRQVVESVLRDVTEQTRVAGELQRKSAYIELLQKIAVASNETSSAYEAYEFAIEQVCLFTGWPVGHVCVLDDSSPPRLVDAELWHTDDADRYRAIREASQATSFAPGEGLPGRVWTSGAPAWIVDVTEDLNYPRARLKLELGIRATFGFPVLVGRRVIAVLEFFSEQRVEPDATLLEIMHHVGTQLGRVAEREQARTALVEFGERYRALTESAVDAIVVSESNGLICDWNRRAESMFGYSKDEIVGQLLERIMPERYREPHRLGMQRLQKTGEAHVIGRTVELHGLRKDGAEFPLELSLSRWRSGGEIFYTGIIRDITERHRAAEAMGHREAILEASAFAAKEFLRASSWQERITDVLERVGRAAGVSRAFVFENRVGPNGALLTSQRYEWAAPGVTPQIDNPELQGFSYAEAGFGRWAEILNRGGTVYGRIQDLPEEERQVLRDQDIQAVAVVPVFVDGWWGFMGYDDCKTERVWSPAELDALGVVASTLGAAILRARDEAALRESERALAGAVAQLEERNVELQQFAYVASHDLQEPLRKVTTFAELLREEYADVVDEDGRMYLDRIHDATGRMSDLIRALLGLSRVSTRGQPFQRVDLNRIVSGVLSDLEIQLSDVGGRVDVDRLGEIQADPMQMRQLFQNLISNALKFRREGVPPVVKITCEPVVIEEDGEHEGVRGLRIEVQDNGIGFDEKYLKQIFAPFQRLHARTHFEGTGIGLAICRRIVERHGGSITARSRPGEGSTFVVTLPELDPRP